MVKIGLTFYEIEIDESKKNSQYNYEIQEYFNAITNIFLNDYHKPFYLRNRKTLITTVKYTIHTLSGMIGFYPQNYNVENRFEKHSGDENDLYFTKPKIYYFLIQHDRNENKIYLILERKSGDTIKNIFLEFLSMLLTEKMNLDVRVKVNLMTPSKLLNKYITEGNIKSIIYYKKNTQKKIFDEMNKVNSDIKTEIRFKEKTFSPQSFLNLNEKILTLDGEEYDDISFRTELYGKVRNISVNNTTNFSPSIEITNNIRYDYEGNPIFDSIDDEARKVAKTHYGIFLD